MARGNGKEVERVNLDGFEADDFQTVEKKIVSMATKGDTITGYYCGSRRREVQGRTTTIHRFITKDDAEIDVWGSAILDSRLSNVRPGFLTRATHVGTLPSNKGNAAKDFKVEVSRQRCTDERLKRAQATMAEAKRAPTEELAESDIPF